MTVFRRDVKFDEEKSMRCSLETELQLHVDEELLAPKEEPQDDVEQPHAEEQRMEAPTHVETSKDKREHTREADILMYDDRENVGAPTSQHRKRRSPDQYTGYMALMSKSVEIEPYSFEEVTLKPIWVDAIIEEYDSIIRNNVWEVAPRLADKSMVSSKWLYKVKQATNGSFEKNKAKFVAIGFSQLEGIDYEETFYPVARYYSIKSILAFSVQMGWKIHQVDVKTSFLNKVIEEDV